MIWRNAFRRAYSLRNNSVRARFCDDPVTVCYEQYQYYNAKLVADRGGAILIEEKDLTNGEVADEIEQLMNDRQILEKMEKASAALGTVTSAGKICDIIGI